MELNDAPSDLVGLRRRRIPPKHTVDASVQPYVSRDNLASVTQIIRHSQFSEIWRVPAIALQAHARSLVLNARCEALHHVPDHPGGKLLFAHEHLAGLLLFQ